MFVSFTTLTITVHSLFGKCGRCLKINCSGKSRLLWQGGSDALRGYLEQRPDSVKGIKQGFIKRPSKDTPWEVQAALPNMDSRPRVFTLLQVLVHFHIGVNCPITASGYAVPSSQTALLSSLLFTLFGPKAAMVPLVLRLEKDCFV